MSDLSPYSQPKPPKTITKVNDDRFLDFTCLHTWILLLTIAAELILFNQIARSERPLQIVYIAILITIAYMWVKYFSSFEKVDKQKLKVKFFIGDIQGKHVINKFSTALSFLEKLVPIVGIHESGIIEFKGSKYGVLLETHPVRISEEERAAHEKRLEKVINGIPSNTHFKTIACSRLEPRKPILQYLLDVSCNSNGDKATDLHLAGLYSKIAEDNSPVISWKYYAFLSLGEWKTLAEAQIQYGAIVPGLLKNMRAARLQPRIYQDEHEISTAYRTMFSELII
jgi:archaellum component FlaF (FlaF/FlaG flagellin family)